MSKEKKTKIEIAVKPKKDKDAAVAATTAPAKVKDKADKAVQKAAKAVKKAKVAVKAAAKAVTKKVADNKVAAKTVKVPKPAKLSLREPIRQYQEEVSALLDKNGIKLDRPKRLTPELVKAAHKKFSKQNVQKGVVAANRLYGLMLANGEAKL
jgi:hypothetical protein